MASPARKHKPGKTRKWGQDPSPREKEKPEFRENGGQTNGGQTRRARKKEIPEFPENGGQTNGGQLS
jgi:hypothetical protein